MRRVPWLFWRMVKMRRASRILRCESRREVDGLSLCSILFSYKQGVLLWQTRFVDSCVGFH